MRVLRIGLALLVVIAIAAQVRDELTRGTFQPVNFFSFFTIVSNLFGAIVLLSAACDVPRNVHVRDVARGAATLCLAIVGIAFSALLANLDSALLGWVNAVVHYVMPIAIVLDWCGDPPRTRLTARDVAWWLVIPLAYVIYSLTRGAIVHWYPYPFLNPDMIGYPAVGAYVAGITCLTVFVAWVLTIAGAALRSRKVAA